jgi:hypothetical protein
MLTPLARIPTFRAGNIVVGGRVVAVIARNVVVWAGIVTVLARIVARRARPLAGWWVIGSWVAFMARIGTGNNQPIPGKDAVRIEDAVGVGNGLDRGAIPP